MSIGLRERKKVATRRSLADAALELFSRHGYEQTTVEEIAAAAEVSPRTFFRYFAAKEDVLFSDADERLAVMVDHLSAQPEDVPVEVALAGAIAVLAAEIGSDRERALLRRQIVESTPALRSGSRDRQAHWEEALADAIRARSSMSSLQARVAAYTSLAVLRAATTEWLSIGGDTDLRRVLARASRQLERVPARTGSRP